MKVASRSKAVLGTFAGSSLSTIIAGLQSILLLPLYIGSAGTVNFGIWLATGELLLWLVAFDCGLPNMMVQRVSAADARGENRIAGGYFASGMVMLTAIAGLLSTTAWIIAPWAVSVLSPSKIAIPEVVYPLRMAAISIGVVIINYGFQGLSRALQRTAIVSASSVLSTIGGFVVTLILLEQGYGLTSIAGGLLVRSTGSLLGGLIFLFTDSRCRALLPELRPSKASIHELLVEAPLQLASGLAYALMNNSQIALAAYLIRPEAAVILGVTRKVAEFIKALLDMVGYSTEGAFAHLFAEGDAEKIQFNLRRLDFTLVGMAVAMLTAYVVANPGFVHVWMGGRYETGPIVTALIALGTLASAWSYVGVSRIRATGAFRTSATILLADCCARLALMACGANIAGIEGLLAGAILPPVISGCLSRLILRSRFNLPTTTRPTIWIGSLTPLALAVPLSGSLRADSWIQVVLFAGFAFAAATLTLVFCAGEFGFSFKVPGRVVRSQPA